MGDGAQKISQEDSKTENAVVRDARLEFYPNQAAAIAEIRFSFTPLLLVKRNHRFGDCAHERVR